MLIAIEGVDGAGKRTLTTGLRAALETAGQSVASLAFPRYGHSVKPTSPPRRCTATTVTSPTSVYAMARPVRPRPRRRSGRDRPPERRYDVVILDRYVASNAAYSAARLHQAADGGVVTWVRELEYERLKLPTPDWQVLLDVPTELAAERAENRAQQEVDRARDAYERDDGLQRRTGEVYAALAATDWCGQWRVAGPDVDAADLAARFTC